MTSCYLGGCDLDAEGTLNGLLICHPHLQDLAEMGVSKDEFTPEETEQ
jgi:hypothetical protein